MLTFAKLANELIYATKLTNEDLVNILLACVYEPLDLKDKNGNPYYAGKGECSYLLKGKRDVKLEIQRGTSKKEVIDHAEAYFESFLISKILPSLLDDFLENMRTIITYDASISEIEIRLAKLEKDRQRYENLVKRNAATPIQLEQIETEYSALQRKLEATKRQRSAALSGVNEVSHRRENVEAGIQRATAALEMAKLNLSYTVVVAPCDGKLGRRALEEGQYITAGQTITYILPDTQKWVIANYKETQVENLAIGQEVRIKVDAVSNKEFTGKITAISGATGAKYSLVPTDNSAGNFVKIQQRIPVRIDFINLSEEDNDRLAAGMMVVVKTKL